MDCIQIPPSSLPIYCHWSCGPRLADLIPAFSFLSFVLFHRLCRLVCKTRDVHAPLVFDPPLNYPLYFPIPTKFNQNISYCGRYKVVNSVEVRKQRVEIQAAPINTKIQCLLHRILSDQAWGYKPLPVLYKWRFIHLTDYPRLRVSAPQ